MSEPSPLPVREILVTQARQLGPILQGWRKSQEFNQSEVGARVGLSQVAVSHLETHPEKASVERLFRLLSALNIEVVLRERLPQSPHDW